MGQYQQTKAPLDPVVIMHRTHWHRQLWISALECKQTTETMTQDDNAEAKIDLHNCCLNTAFTMMRFISCEPCSSVQIIIVQCTRHVQSWHTCFFLRTCFFFTWQRMRRNWCFPQLTKRRTTSRVRPQNPCVFSICAAPPVCRRARRAPDPAPQNPCVLSICDERAFVPQTP